MMAQAMEAVVRFLAEEAVSLVLGFLGGAAYYRCRLWNLRRHAPSATVTTASIALSQQDYDRLKKEGKLARPSHQFLILGRLINSGWI